MFQLAAKGWQILVLCGMQNDRHLGRACSSVAESTFLSMASCKWEILSGRHCRESTGEYSSSQLHNLAQFCAERNKDEQDSSLSNLELHGLLCFAGGNKETAISFLAIPLTF